VSSTIHLSALLAIMKRNFYLIIIIIVVMKTGGKGRITLV